MKNAGLSTMVVGIVMGFAGAAVWRMDTNGEVAQRKAFYQALAKEQLSKH
jgi:hypothetical protein